MNEICPSTSIKEASLLIGLVTAKGSIDYFGTPIEIDDAFKDEANKGKIPESRFRLAGLCVEKKCSNWSEEDKTCHVAKRIIANSKVENRTLPNCGIRSACRWFKQDKSAACKNCSFVIHT